MLVDCLVILKRIFTPQNKHKIVDKKYCLLTLFAVNSGISLIMRLNLNKIGRLDDNETQLQ